MRILILHGGTPPQILRLLRSHAREIGIVLIANNTLQAVEESESDKLMRFLDMRKENTNSMFLQFIAAHHETGAMRISSVTAKNLPYFRESPPYQQQSRSKPKATRRGNHFHRHGRR